MDNDTSILRVALYKPVYSAYYFPCSGINSGFTCRRSLLIYLTFWYYRHLRIRYVLFCIGGCGNLPVIT